MVDRDGEEAVESASLVDDDRPGRRDSTFLALPLLERPMPLWRLVGDDDGNEDNAHVGPDADL